MEEKPKKPCSWCGINQVYTNWKLTIENGKEYGLEMCKKCQDYFKSKLNF